MKNINFMDDKEKIRGFIRDEIVEINDGIRLSEIYQFMLGKRREELRGGK